MFAITIDHPVWGVEVVNTNDPFGWMDWVGRAVPGTVILSVNVPAETV